jgi:hypothetical protein
VGTKKLSTKNVEKSNEKHPELVHENFHSFNLIHYNDTYYGIPQVEGAFEVSKVRNREYTISFSANTIKDLRGQIEEHVGARRDIVPQKAQDG